MLRDAGIQVDTGLMQASARDIIVGHCAYHAAGRPWVTVKIASSLDGAVAGKQRKRVRLTGPRARAFTEALRAEHDAVMIGAGTALSDNPRLLPQNSSRRAPLRVVMDSRLNLPSNLQLFAGVSRSPLWILHDSNAASDSRCESVRYIPVEVSGEVESTEKVDAEHSSLHERKEVRDVAAVASLPIEAALKELAKRGIRSVLCEAGPTLANSLLQANCVDRVVWLTAGSVLGTRGLGAVAGEIWKEFRLVETLRLGEDVASIRESPQSRSWAASSVSDEIASGV